MTRWFRWYAGTTEDGKFRMVARNAKVTVATVTGVWAALLEDASHPDHRGIVTKNEDYFAAVLDLSDGEAEKIFAAMQDADMISVGHGAITITHWKERQFETDTRDGTNAERQRRFRERRKETAQQTDRNGSVTAAKRPDTETDTDSETKKDDVGEGAGANAKIKFLPDGYLDRLTECAARVLADPVNAIGLTDPSIPLMWLREGCDFDLDVIPAVTKVSKSKRVSNVHNWNYFSQAVANAKASREQGLPPASADRPAPSSERHAIARDLRALIRSGEFNVQSAS